MSKVGRKMIENLEIGLEFSTCPQVLTPEDCIDPSMAKKSSLKTYILPQGPEPSTSPQGGHHAMCTFFRPPTVDRVNTDHKNSSTCAAYAVQAARQVTASLRSFFKRLHTLRLVTSRRLPVPRGQCMKKSSATVSFQISFPSCRPGKER